MSRTKDMIMDIMDLYGYIPKDYTFEDYFRDIKKNEKRSTKDKTEEASKESDGRPDNNQQT